MENFANPSVLVLVPAQNKKTLVITYSDMEAKQLADDISFYRDNVALFPSKEYLF